ncbi:nucleoside hydrolase [Labrys monachus]|uniref:Purine nucleosidase n=1 Tax=Labrys monachus TaxID=217067 RepID=A0ABU0FIE7_9HYPH|nr:nucleoside hydrolase [Labrys monachus]MDQ0394355.1 purine nucleosidase [Labrys monachus]
MRLIIDTDTAGDDCFSILMALAEPGVTLEAITICNGNVDFDQQVENALYTLEVAGRGGTVPVYRGCPRPMIRAPVAATEYFGPDGMSDANYPRAMQRPADRHAVDALIDIVMSNPGEIDILAQAPLTNIAAACVKVPEFAGAVRHLWVMGGLDNSIGNTTPASEFNFYVDPEAAKIVMKAGFELTLSTWTLTLSCGVLSPEALSRIEALDTPLSRFFLQVSEAPLRRTRIRYGRAISALPDTLTCACAIDESLILDSAACLVDVETQGELTRGYSSICVPNCGQEAIDDPLWPSGRGNARVIRAADSAAFTERLIRVLS